MSINPFPGEGHLVTVAPHQNGSAPRAPRRTAWVDMPDEYQVDDEGKPVAEGQRMRFRMWLNFPQRILTEIQSGDQERSGAALRQIVLEHNGWWENDEPLPPADDPDFWQAISTNLAVAMLAVIGRESAKIPNSLTRTTGR